MAGTSPAMTEKGVNRTAGWDHAFNVEADDDVEAGRTSKETETRMGSLAANEEARRDSEIHCIYRNPLHR
jgi:hypothetical protein